MVDCCRKISRCLKFFHVCCVCVFIFLNLQLNVTVMFDANIDILPWFVAGKYCFCSLFIWLHCSVCTAVAVALRSCSMLAGLQEHVSSKLNLFSFNMLSRQIWCYVIGL